MYVDDSERDFYLLEVPYNVHEIRQNDSFGLGRERWFDAGGEEWFVISTGAKELSVMEKSLRSLHSIRFTHCGRDDMS